MFLLSLLLDIKPTLLLIASLKFQKNKRLSKLSAKEISEEWIKNYQDAELFLKKENLQDTINILKIKSGNEWRKLFLKLDRNLKKLPDSELIAGLTYYFVTKNGKEEKNYKLKEEDIFLFDTLYQLLELGNIKNPINLKRIFIPNKFSKEAISVTDYLMKGALKNKIQPSALFFYYSIPTKMPNNVKGFFNRIEENFSKRKTIWKLLYIRNHISTYNRNIDSQLPTLIKNYLDERIRVATFLISEKLKKIDMKVFEIDNNS